MPLPLHPPQGNIRPRQIVGNKCRLRYAIQPAAGHKIECPVLALWGTQGFVGRGYERLSVWQ